MNQYPPNWAETARAVKDAAGWRCIRCGAAHSREGWRILTVHHFDGDKSNCAWWNLMALCQRCHLSVQGRVDPHVPWLFEHTHWMKPFAAGFYAKKYLSMDLTREQVEARLEELLGLERVA